MSSRSRERSEVCAGVSAVMLPVYRGGCCGSAVGVVALPASSPAPPRSASDGSRRRRQRRRDGCRAGCGVGVGVGVGVMNLAASAHRGCFLRRVALRHALVSAEAGRSGTPIRAGTQSSPSFPRARCLQSAALKLSTCTSPRHLLRAGRPDGWNHGRGGGLAPTRGRGSDESVEGAGVDRPGRRSSRAVRSSGPSASWRARAAGCVCGSRHGSTAECQAHLRIGCAVLRPLVAAPTEQPSHQPTGWSLRHGDESPADAVDAAPPVPTRRRAGRRTDPCSALPPAGGGGRDGRERPSSRGHDQGVPSRPTAGQPERTGAGRAGSRHLHCGLRTRGGGPHPVSSCRDPGAGTGPARRRRSRRLPPRGLPGGGGRRRCLSLGPASPATRPAPEQRDDHRRVSRPQVRLRGHRVPRR